MRTIRIFFTKCGEAAYISHLDLQRVMARALRRSGLPVWYSQGFNPHIYMSFSLPLPLGQESLCESVDCKTESEQEDFAAFVEPLNAALPRGIDAVHIAQPAHSAAEIASAEYEIGYTIQRAAVEIAATVYDDAETAMVLRKTKRSEQQIDLKSFLPVLQLADAPKASLMVTLPAGGELNINPALLTGFLCQYAGLPEVPGYILRKRVLLANGQEFM